MKYIAVLFALMFPAAGPMEQQFERTSADDCEKFVAFVHRSYRFAPDTFRYKVECKTEKRVREPEKGAIVEEA